ncbi:MAG: hypothetical protein IJ387_10825 [Thermoguttaceae bacterium]|nr:hypothetical protein [Thermoguttaceae bacterium]
MLVQRRFILAACALLTTLVCSAGCAGALMMPFYLINGTDAPAIFADQMKEIPKESKMVVICRSNLNLFGQSNPNADLATSITYVVSNNIKGKKKKKLEWIPYERVEEMFDEEAFKSESFEKMGAKLGADYVIGVEIDAFEIHHSTQFYQGNAKALVRLIDVKTGDTLARQSTPNFAYPPTPIPKSEYQEVEFQKTFTVKFAQKISTFFCPYDPHDEYALDSDFANR